jgi:uncharacterized protein YecT (DUF1311 family)
MKKILLFLSLIFPLAILYPQNYGDCRTYFEKSDRNLNDIYRELITANGSNTPFINNLRNSQRAWIQFRDAQLTLIYPEHASIEKKDSLSASELLYLAHLTDNRTKVLLGLLNPTTAKRVYVSDLELIRTENINGGIGLNKPYWADAIVICGKKYRKGVVIHPKDDGSTAYAEFLIPKEGGNLRGVAGWASEGAYVSYHGRMRYRIYVDNELLYGNELKGKECRGVDINLETGKVLRIETDDGGDGNYSDHMAFGDLRIEY